MPEKLMMALKWAAAAAALCAAAVLLINAIVIAAAKGRILTMQEASDPDADCIIVLGAGVWQDRPSHMLEDRLVTAIAAYESGAAPKLIMSGDHGRTDYDEVNVMKDFAVERGVPAEDVFMDHAGFSTYESMYRAREIFGVQKAVVITQEYHLYRALYLAGELGIEAYGIPADLRDYRRQWYYDLREAVARCKDFVMCIFKPLPTYLGESIPVQGDGNITNDRAE